MVSNAAIGSVTVAAEEAELTQGHVNASSGGCWHSQAENHLLCTVLVQGLYMLCPNLHTCCSLQAAGGDSQQHEQLAPPLLVANVRSMLTKARADLQSPQASVRLV